MRAARRLLVATLAVSGGCNRPSPGPSPEPVPSPRQPRVGGDPATAPTPLAVMLEGADGPVRVEVEVVRTPETIQRGLMFREHLAPNAGMLFFMPDDEVQRFWMRNTLIPLDMIFITRDLTVAGIVENTEPRTDTSRFVETPSRYVLEVNGGWSASHGVRAGTRVTFVTEAKP